MARSTIQTLKIRQPIDGMDRHAGFSKQPITTVADANNVRCRDVWDSRTRLGSRPGLLKSFAQNVSSATILESFTEDFLATKTSCIAKEFPTFSLSGLFIGHQIVGGVSTERSLIHFDLSAIPIAATVVSASMRVYLANANPSADTAKIYRLTVPTWVESEVTWNRASVALDWTDGGEFTTDDELGWNFPVGSQYETFTISGLITLTQDAVTNRSGALSIILKIVDETTADRVCRFYERQSICIGGDDDGSPCDGGCPGGICTDVSPVLTVTYEVAA